MSKATTGDLGQVHSRLARMILDELDFIDRHNAEVDNWAGPPEEKPQRIRLEASLVNSIARFLNDNEITADPEDNDDLKDLQRKLVERTAKHRSIIDKARSLEDGLH